MFIILWTAGASAQQISATSDQHPAERDLAVSIEIVRQGYCRVTPVDLGIYFTIKIVFTNISDHPVILARHIDAFPTLRIARNSADAQNGNFEHESRWDLMTGLSPVPSLGGSPDEKYFVTLLPRQTYEATIRVPGFLTEKSENTGGGPGGSHVLQVEVNTLPYQSPYFKNPINPKQLSKRWSKYGRLASGWVYSDPVSFSLPEQHPASLCTALKS